MYFVTSGLRSLSMEPLKFPCTFRISVWISPKVNECHGSTLQGKRLDFWTNLLSLFAIRCTFVPEPSARRTVIRVFECHAVRLPELGGGDRDERSAARHSWSEHKHGESSPQRWGAICAALWRDAERTRALAFVHAGWGGGAGAVGAGFSCGAGG